jgi:hypothetical protein
LFVRTAIVYGLFGLLDGSSHCLGFTSLDAAAGLVARVIGGAGAGAQRPPRNDTNVISTLSAETRASKQQTCDYAPAAKSRPAGGLAVGGVEGGFGGSYCLICMYAYKDRHKCWILLAPRCGQPAFSATVESRNKGVSGCQIVTSIRYPIIRRSGHAEGWSLETKHPVVTPCM